MRCVKLHRSKATAGVAFVSFASLFSIMLMASARVWNPRIRRLLALVDRLHSRKTRGRGIALAFTGSSLARPPQHCAIWGCQHAALQDSDSSGSLCFRRVPLAQSERRRTCRCGNLEGLDLGRAARPATHAAEPAAREIPGARGTQSHRGSTPSTRASLRRARSSDRGDLNSAADKDGLLVLERGRRRRPETNGGQRRHGSADAGPGALPF